MRKPPPPTLNTTLIGAGSGPMVLLAFIQVAKAGLVPVNAIEPIGVVLAGISTIVFGAVASWWLIADPGQKPCGLRAALRIVRGAK